MVSCQVVKTKYWECGLPQPPPLLGLLDPLVTFVMFQRSGVVYVGIGDQGCSLQTVRHSFVTRSPLLFIKTYLS